MKPSDRKKDPRWQRASVLFDTGIWPRWKVNVPSDPHAYTNIRYAVCMSALTPDEAGMTPESHAGLLRRYIINYVGLKYQEALLDQCERVVRSATGQGQEVL